MSASKIVVGFDINLCQDLNHDPNVHIINPDDNSLTLSDPGFLDTLNTWGGGRICPLVKDGL